MLWGFSCSALNLIGHFQNLPLMAIGSDIYFIISRPHFLLIPDLLRKIRPSRDVHSFVPCARLARLVLCHIFFRCTTSLIFLRSWPRPKHSILAPPGGCYECTKNRGSEVPPLRGPLTKLPPQSLKKHPTRMFSWADNLPSCFYFLN